MLPPHFLLLLVVSSLAGVLGGVTGVGGGIVIVPVLALGLGVPFPEAAGTSLVCVIATSTAGSLALERTKLPSPRLVAHLLAPTAVGAVLGSLAARAASPRLVSGLFAAAVGWSALRMARNALAPSLPADPDAPWTAVRYPLGLAASALAGAASGLLGIGGGPIQVPIQTEVMKVPLHVAVASSNLLVGLTATASLAVYYAAGQIRVDLAPPLVLGSALGAALGGWLAPRVRTRPLAVLFGCVLAYLGVRMLWRALSPAA